MQNLESVFKHKTEILAVKNNTYKDIYTESDAERRTSKRRNTATSGYRKQINKYDE